MLSSRAIVLNRENFGESDRYVQFFSKDWGMITVLAKAARKSKRRYVGGLDLFCHDEIFVRGVPKERPYLVELTVLNSFTGIRDHLEKVLAAGKAVQWVKKLADAGTPMPQVYSLLGQTLAVIENESDPERLDLLTLIFKLKLLSALGLKPRIESCAHCGLTDEGLVFLDIGAGGILCEKCAHAGLSGQLRLALPNDERVFLLLADRFRLTAWEQLQFPGNKTQTLSRLMTQFASYHTHMQLPN